MAASRQHSGISGRSWPRKSAPASRAGARDCEQPEEGIRATVIGASQYTTQVSGSTIFVSPLDALPLRNLPVLAPPLPLDADTIDADAVAAAVEGGAAAPRSRRRRKPGRLVRAVARIGHVSNVSTASRAACWRGCAPVLARGHPLVLAGDGDVGGLIGIHFSQEMRLSNAIVSIDGLELKAFDYIDIGALLDELGRRPGRDQVTYFSGCPGGGRAHGLMPCRGAPLGRAFLRASSRAAPRMVNDCRHSVTQNFNGITTVRL